MKNDFKTWMTDHRPEDNMLWRNSFYHFCYVWNGDIFPLFNYDDASIDVIGRHYSKSIENPVVKITYKGVEIVFRYNFYDYEIAVVADSDICLPMDQLFYSENGSFYFQGFPEEYQLIERYETNKSKFMAGLGGHNHFFAFMFLLRNEIDRIKGDGL